jgi:EAL domain-containing protein (putative c-di-GMP-specific phosphodiesterase class I)
VIDSRSINRRPTRRSASRRVSRKPSAFNARSRTISSNCTVSRSSTSPTTRSVEYELLLRLRTADGRLLPPSAFLYVAEQFGTILAIDSWVVRQAIAMIALQAKAGRSVTLNANISARSIGNPELVAVIDRAFADTPIDPARLVFELTETAAIGNIEHAKTFTTQLSERGCRFALDDFGTGFGSFYYLKHLPFDYFKIDGDFIRGFGTNPTDQLVVEAIVGIAKGMGKKTVAEFVTNQDMADRLRCIGIDMRKASTSACPAPSVTPSRSRRGRARWQYESTRRCSIDCAVTAVESGTQHERGFDHVAPDRSLRRRLRS